MSLKDRVIAALRFRRRDYQLTFSKTSPAAQNVLIDLARFCRAGESCFNADPRVHAVLEGRREVWLRVMQHLTLSSEQLYALIQGKQFNFNEEQENEHE